MLITRLSTALILIISVTGCAQLGQTSLDSMEPMVPSGADSAIRGGLANGMAEPDPVSGQASPQDMWQRLRAGFALDLDQDNDRIRAQRDWFARHPAYLDRVAKRGERYLHHIVEEAEKRNMPLELALLPVVESAFDPFAYSHGRAAGPWQFIPSTGRMFGLKQDYWADQRRDILASTDAALTYLQRLSERFDGDWLLALASYNAGAGTVSRAITRNQRAGKPTDFWNLDLPSETSAYVPKLIAISQIVADPSAHNLVLHPISDEPYFDVVSTGSQIDLAQAADLAGIAIEELYLLNPSYNQWATSPEGPHRLLVPKANANQFRNALAALPTESRMQWNHYTIRSGDSLSTIARRHGVTVDMIRDVNRLRGNTIIAGDSLLIPVPRADAASYSMSEEQRLASRQSTGVSGRQRVDLLVSPGDTLWDISRRYSVGVRELAKWNNMAPGDPLRVGQSLVVWTTNVAAVSTSSSLRPEMIRKVNYAVRKGDSLYGIANRFNVSVNQIASWNSIDTNRYLRPGQRLTLYVDVRNAF